MNDEPSSSASAAARPDEALASDGADQPEKPLTAADMAERRKKNRENFNKRRVELLDDLIRAVDLLIYAELSAIYCMDCSFIRFLIRAFVQLMFLTPKPPLFPEPPPNRPYIGGIFGGNLLCIIMHTLLSAPSAGEATRGYLHGGLAMDFIGQKGPTSKVHLLLLDFLVLALQVIHLSVHILRQKLKESPTAPVSVTTSTGAQYNAQPVSNGQTVDDEERGVRASAERERQGDIEMQTLNSSGASADIEQNQQEPTSSEREALLASTAIPQHTDAHIFDAFNSGQIVVADVDLAKTIREQFWAYQKAPRDANIAESNRLMRERLARRLTRWRFDAAPQGRTLG